MNGADSPIYLSFPLGTWFATRIRVSVFFPLMVLLLVYRMNELGLAIGLTVGAVLFVTILIHEFAHIFAARLTGGYGEEILIWPLGGLAFCHPSHSVKSRLLTPAAGPIFHLIVCLFLAYPVYALGRLGHCVNPLTMNQLDLIGLKHFGEQLAVIVFAVNWVLLLLNLIPVYPLDGGRILRTLLSMRLPAEASTQLYIRIGVIFGFVFLLAGMFMDNTMVVVLGALVLVLNMQESFRMQTADRYDDSFMGYDFSQGYTSLERSDDDEPKAPRKSALKRWREKRAAKKEEQERQRAVEEEAMLDTILDKVHRNGQKSLTDAERKLLERASARLRNKERDA